jgi:hypothetical protein
MEKYFYRLIARGTVEKTYNGDLVDEEQKVTWNVPHYSKLKYVVAKDLDVARALMREHLTERKWTGYRLVHVELQKG